MKIRTNVSMMITLAFLMFSVPSLFANAGLRSGDRGNSDPGYGGGSNQSAPDGRRGAGDRGGRGDSDGGGGHGGFDGGSCNCGDCPMEIEAVPEPTTLTLMGLGLAGAGLYRRYKKRSNRNQIIDEHVG